MDNKIRPIGASLDRSPPLATSDWDELLSEKVWGQPHKETPAAAGVRLGRPGGGRRLVGRRAGPSGGPHMGLQPLTGHQNGALPSLFYPPLSSPAKVYVHIETGSLHFSRWGPTPSPSLLRCFVACFFYYIFVANYFSAIDNHSLIILFAFLVVLITFSPHRPRNVSPVTPITIYVRWILWYHTFVASFCCVCLEIAVSLSDVVAWASTIYPPRCCGGRCMAYFSADAWFAILVDVPHDILNPPLPAPSGTRLQC